MEPSAHTPSKTPSRNGRQNGREPRENGRPRTVNGHQPTDAPPAESRIAEFLTPEEPEDRSSPTPGGVGGIRRILNVAAAAIGIVLTAPLMAVIAVLVRLSGPGPILYTQPRVGIDCRRRSPSGSNGQPNQRQADLGGCPFQIYKFRTMHVGSDNRQSWATQDDPRVTGIGRILRCTRLDELPQLFNVLRGEMNVVGPRPEQPEIFARLRTEVPGYEKRQVVLPGITGWAQVNRCYDRSVEDVKEKVALDLEYIGRASLTQDLRIMLRTPAVMLGRENGW